MIVIEVFVLCWEKVFFPNLSNAVKALALAELVFYLPGTLFSLLKAAHRIGLLTMPEVDVAKVEVCAVEVLQQLTFSLRQNPPKMIVIITIFL